MYLFKNCFLSSFVLLVFVSRTCMRKNGFLVSFSLLVFVSDVSWCVLGCCFPSVIHLCMSLSLSLQKNHFLRGFMFVLFVSATCMYTKVVMSQSLSYS